MAYLIVYLRGPAGRSSFGANIAVVVNSQNKIETFFEDFPKCKANVDRSFLKEI